MSEQFEFCKITKVDANLLNVRDENETRNLSEYICQHPLQTAGVAASVIVGAHVFIPLVETCIAKATPMAERLLGFSLRNGDAEAANVLRAEANAGKSAAEKIGAAADNTAATATELPKVEIVPKPTEPISEAANNAGAKVSEDAENAASKPATTGAEDAEKAASKPATTSAEDAAKTEKAPASDEPKARTRRASEKAEKPATEKPRKTDGQRLAEQVSFLEPPPAKWTRIGSNSGMVDWLRRDLSVVAKDSGAKAAETVENAVTKAGKTVENAAANATNVADDAAAKTVAENGVAKATTVVDDTAAKATTVADDTAAKATTVVDDTAAKSGISDPVKSIEELNPVKTGAIDAEATAAAKGGTEVKSIEAASSAKTEAPTAVADEAEAIVGKSRARRFAAIADDAIVATGKTDGAKLMAQLDFLKPPPAPWTRIGSNSGLVDFLRKDLRT